MRTLIDIPENELERLDSIAREARRSRASMVREAIVEYLTNHETSSDSAFGLWGKRGVDGLAYQKKVRSEW
jgi:metal-responsive CopG/Arc/MetJ family transcriptional regulator